VRNAIPHPINLSERNRRISDRNLRVCFE
jgi:hypothetical protein